MSLFQFIKSKTFFKVLLKMLIIGVALIFILKYWLGCSTNHNQKIEVPNLSGKSVLMSKNALNDLNLRYKIMDTVSYNPKYPPLSVVEQDPEAGDFVKEHRKIYISLNRGTYQRIKIPKLIGKTKRHVESVLRSLDFKIGTYSYVPDIGKNVVRGLRCAGKKVMTGEKLPKKSTINLILGDGKASYFTKDSVN